MATDKVIVVTNPQPAVQIVNAQPEIVEIVERGEQGPPGTTTWAGLQNIPAWITGITAWALGLLGLGSYNSLKSSLNLSKGDVGLGNVDNTSDANKPVSSAQATAIATALATAEGYTDTAKASAISTSEAYTDTAKAQAISTAAADATTKANTAQANAIAASDPAGSASTVQTYILGLISSITSSVGSLVTGVSSVAGKTGAVSLVKADVGLSNVDNTSDLNKPISSATQTALDAKINSSLINAANGVAGLDSASKIPVALLPAGVFTYKGTWNPSTNTPTLANGTGVAGSIYQCSTGGTIDIGAGNLIFQQNDWVIYNGSAWEVSPGNDGVYSVAGLTGATINGTALKAALAITESDVANLTTDLAAGLQRANHQGTQTASTISDFATALRATTISSIIANNIALGSTDSVNTAFGKLQGQLNNVISKVLTGLSTATSTAVVATDTILAGIGKLQAQINTITAAGYQTAAQVTTAITAYGYQTASQVATAITSYGYQTAAQVISALTWTNLTGKPSSFTPSAHASTHASGGSDPITISATQVTGLSTAASAASPVQSVQGRTGTVVITASDVGLPTGGTAGQAVIVNSAGTALTFGTIQGFSRQDAWKYGGI